MAKTSADKKWPEGTTFEPWYVAEGAVRRNVTLPDGTRTSQRLPTGNYQAYRKDPQRLSEYVDRINHRDTRADEARKKLALARAFVDPKTLESFEALLLTQIPSPKDARHSFTLLEDYFLSFFVTKLGLIDPKEWAHIDNQVRWAEALLNGEGLRPELRLFPAGEVRSRYTIVAIVQMANRFLTYLHEKDREAYPLMRLRPLSKKALDAHEARRLLRERAQGDEGGLYIEAADWEEIRTNAGADIRPFLELAYLLGLRRAETLGCEVEHIYVDHFFAQVQLRSINERGEYKLAPLKDLDARRVPFWFTTPEEIYELVASIKVRMHPDTLSDRFALLTKTLGLSYTMHDFRRTFITRALRTQAPTDVQAAAGHADITTTMRYKVDDRALSTQRFIPLKRTG